MELSLVERMLMAQNFEILAKLNPGEADSYEWRAEVLRSGHELLYPWLAEAFAQGGQIVTPEEGRYVLDVLAMYDTITWSVQQKKISLPEGAGLWFPFPGFDGNEEGKLLGFADHFCTERRYEILKQEGRIPNSHMPTRGIYARMLRVWKEIKPRREGLLTEEEILQLLRAP